jgi:MFS family permease
VAFRLLTGFGQALYSVARHTYIAGVVRVGVRGRAIALFGGIMRVGRFAGPMIGGIVAKGAGLRTPFLIAGTACGMALAAMAAFVRAGDTQAQAPQTGPLQGSATGRLASIVREELSVLASAGAGQLFAQMIRAGRGIVIPLYAADAIGLDVQQIGFIVSISSAVDMLFSYPAGMIMDRLGRKYAIVPSFVLQAIGMGLVPVTGSFAGLLLAASLIGFGNGFSSGSMMTLGADLSPPDARGEFLGVWRLIGDVGSSGGPLVVGAVADAVALPVAALMMAGAGLMAGTVFGFLVPETLGRRQPETRLSTSSD